MALFIRDPFFLFIDEWDDVDLGDYVLKGNEYGWLVSASGRGPGDDASMMAD